MNVCRPYKPPQALTSFKIASDSKVVGTQTVNEEKERDKREWAHSAVLDEMDIIGAMRIRAETTPKHYCTTSSRMLAAWRDRDREKKKKK